MVDQPAKHSTLTRVGFDGFFRDPSGLVHQHMGGRKRVVDAEVYGGTEAAVLFRPSRRIVVPPHQSTPPRNKWDEPVTKISKLPYVPATKKRAERRHITPNNPFAGVCMDDLAQGLQTVMIDDTTRAADRRGQERPFVAEMTRKRREFKDRFGEKRAGVTVQSSGDKPYRAVAYQPGYYKEPGLVPGSTFVHGDHPRNISALTTKWKAFKAERPDVAKRPTYAELQHATEYRALQEEVRRLYDWAKGALPEEELDEDDSEEGEGEEQEA
ncbi:unnamed protein product [Vitrella brassicaformis CCMP3155]|uniref:Uncharacterized protein n=1 Tax=Vitrella brassicaformis (strain CCMP3155) TaxID=1169540 RepID=A0A0G4F7A9_VITBC|nr:unnamed protein product [Vitrella brassicaformis CCMP3155]|eukprot:CEM08544.1 unnamed protein product [Vitrella brassicaformis CCMP3155]